jgi:hypothetical protein
MEKGQENARRTAIRRATDPDLARSHAAGSACATARGAAWQAERGMIGQPKHSPATGGP